MSVKGKPYGSEYHTVLKAGNIKFVMQNDAVASTKTPLETMTRGRVYVTVNKENNVKAITYYDNENKRVKQIDVTGTVHKIKGAPTIPHAHDGYEHDKGTRNLTAEEKKMVARVLGLWNNRNSK